MTTGEISYSPSHIWSKNGIWKVLLKKYGATLTVQAMLKAAMIKFQMAKAEKIF